MRYLTYILACLTILVCSACTIDMPTEYTLIVCVVDGDTIIVGADDQEIACAKLDSLFVDDNDG